jgi:hypothetical protein
MASEKTLYWVTVAVMAVLAGNHFANKYEGGCITDRAVAMVQRLSGEASHLLAMGQVALGSAPRLAGPELAMARVQSHFASMQADMARQQAACARLEAEHARMMAIEQMQHVRVRVICPRQSVRVEIPSAPVVASEGTI